MKPNPPERADVGWALYPTMLRVWLNSSVVVSAMAEPLTKEECPTSGLYNQIVPSKRLSKPTPARKVFTGT